MATSSILDNIEVNNPKAIEEFVAAMDRSQTHRTHSEAKLLTDPEQIRDVVKKGIQNWSKVKHG